MLAGHTFGCENVKISIFQLFDCALGTLLPQLALKISSLFFSFFFFFLQVFQCLYYQLWNDFCIRSPYPFFFHTSVPIHFFQQRSVQPRCKRA